MNKITVVQAEEIIRKSKGKFITVAFIKRTDSSLRVMNCRTMVTKHLNAIKHLKKSVSKKRSPGLIRVYDVQNKGYRQINVSGLRIVKAFGKEFIVE